MFCEVLKLLTCLHFLYNLFTASNHYTIIPHPPAPPPPFRADLSIFFLLHLRRVGKATGVTSMGMCPLPGPLRIPLRAEWSTVVRPEVSDAEWSDIDASDGMLSHTCMCGGGDTAAASADGALISSSLVGCVVGTECDLALGSSSAVLLLS